MTTRVELVWFKAGGGHRAAALALEAVIAERGWDWSVTSTDLLQVLDPRGRFERATGMKPEAYYNQRLARGWTFGLGPELKVLQSMIRFAHPWLLATLQRHWSASRPDLVVSLVPNFNRALCESLGVARPGVPYVTVMTDLADLPPHFWIEADPRQHVVCGSARAARQALDAGRDAAWVHRTSGMIVRPDFYRPVAGSRRDERIALGLDPDRPTGLVLFGGYGSAQMLAIDRRLPDVQLVSACGHNAKLADRLRRHASRAQAPRIVVGFTPDVRRYMRLCDFFVGKPGPGSVSEALQQGLPVVTACNASTMPQERYNARWIEEGGFGLVIPSMRRIRAGVLELTGRLEEFAARVRSVENRAVFEVPDLLRAIVERDASPKRSPIERAAA